MKFKFKELDEPVSTMELYYDLFDGGYIDPSEMLEDPAQVKKVLEAKKLLEEFLQQAQDAGALEIC